MRARDTRPTSLPAPPEALIWFTAIDGVSRGPGAQAYPDREAWLAARHDWEDRHGMTIGEWSDRTHAELVGRARLLDEVNEALELTMYEPDVEEDWLVDR